MFDISFSELALCFVVALVVLGPERLPKVARALGRWSGQAKVYMRNLTTELERETQIVEIKKQFQEAQQALLESKAELERSTRALASEVENRIKPPDAVAMEPAAAPVTTPAATTEAAAAPPPAHTP